MRSKWLDWPRSARIMDEMPSAEPTKPTKPGFVGFVGTSARSFSITQAHGPAGKLPVSDPYAERMRAALREINLPDYAVGMVPWLGTTRPDFYAEITSHLPDEIQRLWSEHAPLDQFEAVLARLVSLHKECCHLYRSAHMRGCHEYGSSGL